MRAGAAGFILKDARRDQLIHAIHMIAEGDVVLAYETGPRRPGNMTR